MGREGGGIDEGFAAYVRERGDHHLRVAVRVDPQSLLTMLESATGVFRDAQRERGGVVGGERVRDSRNPAWRRRAGFAVHGVGGVLILLI